MENKVDIDIDIDIDLFQTLEYNKTIIFFA